MKLSRRETMVGGVLGLMAPRPPLLSDPDEEVMRLARLTKAELVALRKSLDELVERFNKHRHWYDPIVESRLKASGA